MSDLRKFAALLLVVLWLPATLHCEMEMAGVFADCATCHNEKPGDGTGSDCDTDGGGMIESSALRLPSASFLLKTADATDWLLLAVSPLEITPQPLVPLDCTTAPAELIHTWQFVVRAALPARAPDPLNA